MSNKPVTIWDRLQFEDATSLSTHQSAKKEGAANNNLVGIIGTVVGIIFWTYVIIQVFFLNFDSYLIERIGPLQPLVEYKFFTMLLLVVLLAFFVKRYYFVYFYILFFPLILIFWKIPKQIYKFKSWILALLIVDWLSSILSKFKYKIIVFSVTLFCFLFIVTSDSRVLLLASISTLLLCLVLSFINTIYSSFKTPVFLKFQSSLLNFFTKSEVMKKTIFIDEKIKSSKSKKLTTEQSRAVLTNMQNAVLIHRLIYFWAYQLEKYRTSKISFLLNGLSYMWLYVRLVIYLSFVNYGLYKVNPESFEVSKPTFIAFLNYSLNSIFFSEVTGIIAISDDALLVRLFSGVVGGVLLTIFIVNVIHSVLQTKNDKDLAEAIAHIKTGGKDLEAHIKGEYSITPEEAMQRLQEFKGSFISLILAISSQMPKGYK